MSYTNEVTVQTGAFNFFKEYEALRFNSLTSGAIVTFSGLVRDFNVGNTVSALSLEHYASMTEKILADLIAEARQFWRIDKVRIIHRVGELLPADQIVFIGVSSEHRSEAFASCEFLMAMLKTQAPFWKKEQNPEGARWVSPRLSDQLAAQEWYE